MTDPSTNELELPLIEYLESIDVEFDHAQEIVRRFTEATREARLDELSTLNFDGGNNLVTWAGDGKAKLIPDRIAQLEQQTKEELE